MSTNKEIQNYLNKIKLLLPVRNKASRNFIRNISERVNEVVQESPEITFEEIENQLGTPFEIAQSYIASLDLEVLIKQLSITRILRRIFATVLICLILSVSIFATFTYKAYLDSKNTVVTNTTTVIADE